MAESCDKIVIFSAKGQHLEQKGNTRLKRNNFNSLSLELVYKVDNRIQEDTPKQFLVKDIAFGAKLAEL